MSEEIIKIEKDIPAPSQTYASTGISKVFRKLEVGNSFIWKSQSGATLHTMARQCGIQITIRKQPDGSYRIWRKS